MDNRSLTLDEHCHYFIPTTHDIEQDPFNENNMHKDDNEQQRHCGYSRTRTHPSQTRSDRDTISVTIVDSEGLRTYFQKSYNLGIKINIEKALDQIRSHVCTVCSNPQMLEFWYEPTELKGGQTVALLGMQEGDTIDIRLKETCTRGAHPVLASQTTPNMHYLDVGIHAALVEDMQSLPTNETVHLTFRNDTRFSISFRLRVNHPISKACEAFEVRLGLSVGTCRFHSEGDKIDRTKTPLELKLEDPDLIECYTEQIGGGGSPQSQHASRNAAETPFSKNIKPLPSTPEEVLEQDSPEEENISQTLLTFIDEYSHHLPVSISSIRPLLQALEYVAFRMGKNASNLAFEIQGTRIDLEVLGSKTAVDLGLEDQVEVHVWWTLLPPTLRKEPDDEMVPRSVKYGVQPPANYVKSPRN